MSFTSSFHKKTAVIAIAAGAALLAWFWRSRRRLAQVSASDLATPPPEPRRDRVDEAGWESFPASDPPGTYR